MLSIKRRQSDILGLLECLFAFVAFESEHSLALPFLSIAISPCNRVTIFVELDLTIVALLLFLDDFDVHFTAMGVALHAIPHAVGLVVHVVDPVAVDFGASVHDLA